MKNFDNYIVIDGGQKFDVLKIVLAVMVVMIHTKPLPNVFMPLLRCAVPLFFIMSSYFFFLKQQGQTKENQYSYLNNYILRILKLYLFWFVVLLPFTIMIRKWYTMPISEFIPYFFLHLFFGNTFKASWYLMATILGLGFVFYLSKLLNDRVLIIVGFCFYLIACLSSNYYGFIDHITWLSSAYHSLTSLVNTPHNSFFVAVLWVVIGKIIATRHIFSCNKTLIFLLIMSFILLYVEYVVLNKLAIVKTNDCYLMLIPTCFFLFVFIGRNKFIIPSWINTIKCRKLSTIIYCSHLTLAAVISALMSFAHISRNGVLLFFATLLFCVMIGLFILFFEDKHKLSILKYSH